MTTLVDRLWYGTKRPLWLLLPLARLYRVIADNRRRQAWRAMDDPIPVPVVVVGNITAGGTGKSPLTAWLVSMMQGQGWRPVILSRGYGGRSKDYPLLVDRQSNAAIAGDEPVMLAAETGVPVVVDPQRKRGALWALERGLGNMLICDDGLQHYRLPRDIEIAVFDASRGLGNGETIPVGPLREPVERLASVDFVVTNGGLLDELEHPRQFAMTLRPSSLWNLSTGESRPLSALKGRNVRAVAGIGNPARFFNSLRSLGAMVEGRAFSDHHRFKPADLAAGPDEWLVMTAKDAVKCRDVAPANAWVLSVTAELPAAFREQFLTRINECTQTMSSEQTVRKDHG